MFAATGRHTLAIKMLLAAGASLEAVELKKADHVRLDGRRTASRSYTAMQIAEANGDEASLAVLREHSERLQSAADAAAAALLADEEELTRCAASSPDRSSNHSNKKQKDKRRREEKR